MKRLIPVQPRGVMTDQRFMKRHVSLCYGTLASLALIACFSNARAARSAGEPQASELSSSSYTDTGPSESERFACYGALAIEVVGHSGELRKALNDWFPAAQPLLPQFEFTPWDDVPAHAQVLVREEWARNFREAIAKRAIELKAPVGSIVCLPEYPTCDQFDPANSGVYYSSVIGDQLLKFYAASEDLLHGIEKLRIAVDSGLNSAILSGVNEQYDRLAAVRKGVAAFYALLPRNAVLPRIKWPEVKGQPTECRDVMKEAM